MNPAKRGQNNPILEDEIDLYELWEGLVQEKLAVLYSFLAVVLMAVVYVFVSTPVYQAKTYLLPPETTKITSMNVLVEALDLRTAMNTVESVFKQFQAVLMSRQVLKAVFNQYNLERVYSSNIQNLKNAEYLKAQQKAFEQFIKDFSMIEVSQIEGNTGVVAQLSLVLGEGEVAEILNALVLKANQITVREIAFNFVFEKEARMRLIEQKIAGARQVEKDRRLDRIAQLEEAIQITKRLNLIKPIASESALNVNNMNETVQGVSVALYLLGSEFLEAEKYVLEQRKNDDAFIVNLRSWQEALQLLKSLKVDPNLFGVVQIDQEAVLAEKIKPKKLIVLAVAGVLGIMLGIFIALIRRAMKKRKEMVLN